MKKLIQVSLVVVLMFVLLQAVVGGAFGSPDKIASHENLPYATAPTQVLNCSSRRPVHCAVPLVGWNS